MSSAPRWIPCALLLVATPAAAASFTFYPYAGDGTTALDDTEVGEWINRSRCLCDAYLQADAAPSLVLDVYETSGSLTDDEVYFYLGDDCDDTAVSLSEACLELDVINLSDFNVTQSLAVPANQVVDPVGGECSEVSGGSSTIFAIVGDTSNTASTTYTIAFDTAPPGMPVSLAATPGEGALTVSWEPPDEDDADIERYVVLCATGGQSVFGASDAWSSPELVCGLTEDGAAWTGCDGVTGGLVEGEVPSPCFVCGTASAAATSARIEGLVNGTTYELAVVAVDDSGNPGPVSEVVTGVPVPTTDFAEQYAASGGREDGGFCFVATELYGDYDHPDVRVLRRLRDEVLMRTGPGRGFVRWYYRNGPTLALLTRIHPDLRGLAQVGVRGLTLLSRLMLGAQGCVLVLLVVLVWSGARLPRPRRRASRIGGPTCR